MSKVHVQDLASVRLNETVEELADKLTASADAVLAMSEADLAEAIEAYSSMTEDGGVGVVASDEDEDLFACRAALLRLHHLQLLTKAPSEMPDVYIRLQKLLQVLCSLVCLSVSMHLLDCCSHAQLPCWGCLQHVANLRHLLQVVLSPFSKSTHMHNTLQAGTLICATVS